MHYGAVNSYQLNCRVNITRRADNQMIANRALAHVTPETASSEHKAGYRLLLDTPDAGMPMMGDLVTILEPANLVGEWRVAITPYLMQNAARPMIRVIIVKPQDMPNYEQFSPGLLPHQNTPAASQDDIATLKAENEALQKKVAELKLENKVLLDQLTKARRS